MPGLKPVFLALVIVSILVLIWFLDSPDPESNIPKVSVPDQSIIHNTDISLAERVKNIEQKLNQSKTGLQNLAQRLSQIEQQLADIPGNSHTFNSPDSPIEIVQDPAKIVKPPTLQDKLVSSNIPLDTIQRIELLVGKNRLARLELRDKAIREDWLDTPEYIEQQQQLPRPTDGLREEFGDEVYDQYLYASGRPNRIIVREVFVGSAASAAGIKTGDIITSYASNPVFTMSDLQQATTEGYSGEVVLIELLRDDLPFSTTVPRGPLGISMSIINRQP